LQTVLAKRPCRVIIAARPEDAADPLAVSQTAGAVAR